MVETFCCILTTISYVGYKNATPKDSCTLRAYVRVCKRPFDRIERGWLDESKNRSTSGPKGLNVSNKSGSTKADISVQNGSC
ncbi:hypothetical protein TNCV_1741001 [Trichonephila clavipes]|uniref:Uncharacterized protein n=1 Tax=Trichonephila clavipes TaxID=2585209 RepID=A0A8X6RCL4_TRICX|nr:hypothetical protein TNCV_1741001 [Trichonephila clavipes]